MKRLLTLSEPVDSVTCAEKLFGRIQGIAVDYSQENFLVFFLNSVNRIIAAEIIFKGGLNTCIIDPKVIFRKALLHNACSIIAAHNHPSGNLKPSSEDLEMMKKISRAGEIITINLLDFIVFNEEEYWSCVE